MGNLPVFEVILRVFAWLWFIAALTSVGIGYYFAKETQQISLILGLAFAIFTGIAALLSHGGAQILGYFRRAATAAEGVNEKMDKLLSKTAPDVASPDFRTIFADLGNLFRKLGE